MADCFIFNDATDNENANGLETVLTSLLAVLNGSAPMPVHGSGDLLTDNWKIISRSLNSWNHRGRSLRSVVDEEDQSKKSTSEKRQQRRSISIYQASQLT